MARRKIPPLMQTKIRLPTALRRNLQHEADKKKQPLNAEIIERLERSFLQQNTLALIQERIDNAFKAFALEARNVTEATAEAAAKKAVESLRGDKS